jgi:hypothetical protein
MKIAIVGAGKIGGTIGERWEKAGHDVHYGLRDPSKREGAKTVGSALAAADTILLALPGAAIVQFVREHAKELDGKVIIDATNHFAGAKMNSWPETTALVPAAQLYRAFNTLGWDVFADPVLGDVQPDLFYCGPEDGGQKVVEQLISDAGLRPIWVGGIDQVDTVDGVLRLWFVLSRTRGRRIAFKLISD